jgi:hypothetical protein
MLEDLKKIEESWREMDEFAAFSNRLLAMTNLIQRKRWPKTKTNPNAGNE